ncbi:MAG TPA: hypothetical protein VF526_04240 [Solirubrobacteraceae bacterium]
MADRQDSDRDVLTSLPRSRPVRRSAKRGAPPAAADAPKKRQASSKPVAAQKPAATPRRKAGEGKPHAPGDGTKTPAKPAAAASRKRAAAGERAKAARPRTATTRPRREATPRREREREPERVAPARKVPPAGYAAPDARDQRETSDAAQLLSTAVQAANELARIGLTVGRQTLQSMLDRLPKP